MTARLGPGIVFVNGEPVGRFEGVDLGEEPDRTIVVAYVPGDITGRLVGRARLLAAVAARLVIVSDTASDLTALIDTLEARHAILTAPDVAATRFPDRETPRGKGARRRDRWRRW